MSGLEVFGTVSAAIGLVQATASLYNYLSQLSDEKREIADLAKEMNATVDKLKQFYQDNKEILDKNGLTPAARDLVKEMVQLRQYATKEVANRKGFRGTVKNLFKGGDFARKLRQFNGNIDRSYRHWQMSIQVTNLSHIDELEKQNRELEAEIAQQKALLEEKRRLAVVRHNQLRQATAWTAQEVAASLDQLLQGVRGGLIQFNRRPFAIEAEPRLRYKDSSRVLIRVSAKVAVFSIVTSDGKLEHKRIQKSLNAYCQSETARPTPIEDETFDLVQCLQEPEDVENLLSECEATLKEIVKAPTDTSPLTIIQKTRQVALILWHLGLSEEADHVAKCTVDLARCLMRYQPNTPSYVGDLADTLVAVVRIYEGHPSTPRDYYTEAVELRKTLAAKDKIGTSEESIALASTLAVAASWARLDRALDKGLEWIQTATLIEQELNRRWPEKHRSRLAACLLELGYHLHANRHLQDAIFVFSEAVRHFRHFYAINPTIYSLPLVRSLRGYGNALAHYGEYDGSDEAFREALTILRAFPSPVPGHITELYNFELSRVLVFSSHSLASRGEWDDAVQHASEGLGILATHPMLLPHDDPEWYQRPGRLHAMLIERSRGAGYTHTALVEGALEVARGQYAEHPERYRFKYAGCLSTCAWILCKSSSRAFDALKLAQEAAELGRLLVLDQPRAYREALAYHLDVLGTILCETGQVREGIQCLNEGLRTLCLVHATEKYKNPARRKELLDTIENVGNMLSDHQAPLEEYDTLWEAVALL